MHQTLPAYILQIYTIDIYYYCMKSKNFTIVIFTAAFFLYSLSLLGTNYYEATNVSENNAYCVVVYKNKKKYCKTDKFKFYNTIVNFEKKQEFELQGNDVDLKSMDIPSLKLFRKKITDKAIRDSFFILESNRRNLAKAIIKYQNSDNIDDKDLLLEDISKSADIISYVKKADSVKIVKSFPSYKILNDVTVKYVAAYNSEVYNYYSEDGKLIFRMYSPNNVIQRIQKFDDNGNFYTYDNKENLLGYSKGLEIYDGHNKLIYKLKSEDRAVPSFRKQLVNGDERRKIFLEDLNNPNSDKYLSVTPVIDKYYEKGSAKEMIEALNKYFTDLKISNPFLYSEYKNLIAGTNFTLNFAKYDGRYIFAINNSNLEGFDKIAASMAETANKFHSKCSEPNLKTLAPKGLVDIYFYDIKIYLKKGKITCKEHLPCSACSRNISLWGWKYPSK